jgi:hypothetical protein
MFLPVDDVRHGIPKIVFAKLDGCDVRSATFHLERPKTIGRSNIDRG